MHVTRYVHHIPSTKITTVPANANDLRAVRVVFELIMANHMGISDKRRC